MTRASKQPRIGVGALQLQGTAEQLIRRIDTPEKAAEFYVNAQEPFAAIGEVMRHVKGMLMLEAKERTLQVGAAFVSAEPNEYSYDIAAVRELAPECIVTKEVATSDKMQRINELAQRLWRNTYDDSEADIEEIIKLSQPEMLEAVDANKLRGILGRGDERAQKLMARRVKTPVGWKLVVREAKGESG